MRAEDGQLTAEQLSHELDVPERTARFWLQRWYAMGVTGIERVASRGRYRFRYACSVDLPARWRRGELPNPQSCAAAA